MKVLFDFDQRNNENITFHGVQTTLDIAVSAESLGKE